TKNESRNCPNDHVPVAWATNDRANTNRARNFSTACYSLFGESSIRLAPQQLHRADLSRISPQRTNGVIGDANIQLGMPARTVGELRKSTTWPENLAITTPHCSSCPLYTRKRTCAVQLGMSALGQKQTSHRL